MHQSGKRRVKTQASPLLAQVERQKSIFKNLNWQNKQKQKKIQFLERYKAQLEEMITKQKEEDGLLLKRAQQFLKKRRDRNNKSIFLKPLYDSQLNRRVPTHLSYQKENVQQSCNPFLQDIYFSGISLHKK